MRFLFFLLGALMSVTSFCHGGCDFGNTLVGQKYVLVEDLFLYQRGGPGNVTLAPPGWTSDVPPSIACYLADSENWMHSEEARSKCVSSDIHLVRILAVLPAGTQIKICRFKKRKNPLVGTFYSIYGTVEDPRFSNREVLFFALFNGKGGKDFNPRPREEFLRAADQ